MTTYDSTSDDPTADTDPDANSDSQSPAEPMTLRLDAETVAETGLGDVPKETLEEALAEGLRSVAATKDSDQETSTQEASLDAEELYLAFGHEYAQVDPHCPRCGETLTFLQRRHVSVRSGAPVECKGEHCEWSGRAVFEIVDIQHNDAGTIWSGVLDGDVEPTYYDYESL